MIFHPNVKRTLLLALFQIGLPVHVKMATRKVYGHSEVVGIVEFRPNRV